MIANEEQSGPGLRTWLAVAALYVAAVVAGSRVGISWDPRAELPATLTDPLQHIWVMKWMRTCLLEGRLPLICPEIEHPVGAPLGNFSPMHLQSLLFIPLSLILKNDILVYNLVWLVGFLLTGLGTFALAYHVTRDRGCAAFAGLAAMLSGPMFARAVGHLELMYIGGFPLFLLAWIRFVDRPTRGRLLAAAGLYLLVALSAAYYLVFAIFPAALYAAWAWVGARRSGERGWLRARWRPFVGFGLVVAPLLGLAFAPQVWAAWHGFSPGRSEAEFNRAATPVWSYLFPLKGYRFEPYFPINPFRNPALVGAPGSPNAYLGLATIGLVAYAAARRVRFARASFWWLTLAMLVVLGMGAYWQAGGVRVPLPSAVLRKVFLPFRLIREVDRFNLFVVVAASVVAAAGLKHLGRRLRGPVPRAALVGLAMLVAFLDLALLCPGTPPPTIPDCYAAILRVDPAASFLEVNGEDLNAVTGYWQSIHRGRSTAAFSGLPNVPFLNLVKMNSAFVWNRVEGDWYLNGTDVDSFDYLSRARFGDQAWLFLHAHDLRYVVVHKGGLDGSWNPPGLPRIDALLAGAKVYEDARTAVYARDRMPGPTGPALLPMRGWRAAWDGRLTRVAGRSARMLAYNPDPDTPWTFRLAARAAGRDRVVKLTGPDGAELARWRVESEGEQTYLSPPIRLPAGVVRLTLVSDGEARVGPRIDGLDPGAFSLKVGALGLEPAPAAVAAGPPGEVR